MCAGFEQGGGSCHGDSGGPLLKYDHDNLHYVQIGIVQGGVANCGDQYFHNIYVRVDADEIFDFIADAMSEVSVDKESMPRSASITPIAITTTEIPTRLPPSKEANGKSAWWNIPHWRFIGMGYVDTQLLLSEPCESVHPPGHQLEGLPCWIRVGKSIS